MIEGNKRPDVRQSPVPLEDPAAFAGRYVTPVSDGALVVTLKDDALHAQLGSRSSPLLPIAANRFFASELGGVVDFVPGKTATLRSPYLRDFTFSRERR